MGARYVVRSRIKFRAEPMEDQGDEWGEEMEETILREVKCAWADYDIEHGPQGEWKESLQKGHVYFAGELDIVSILFLDEENPAGEFYDDVAEWEREYELKFEATDIEVELQSRIAGEWDKVTHWHFD